MNLTEIFVNKLAKDSKVVTIDSLFLWRVIFIIVTFNI